MNLLRNIIKFLLLRHETILCGIFLLLPSARADFAALIFNGKNKAISEVQQLEKLPNGRFRATHNLPPVSTGDGAILEYKGKKYPLNPDMATHGACQFYLNLVARRIATDENVVRDLLHFNSMPARRAVTLTEGSWIKYKDFIALYEEDFTATGKVPPVAVAFRLKDKPFLESPEELIKIVQQKENAFEVFVPKNLLTVSYGQEVGSAGELKRTKLPWQYYEKLFDHEVPADSVAFEMGKASADGKGEFSDLLHGASFAALKEATLWGRPLDKSYVYVHATDAAHEKLYRNWGFKVVATGKDQPNQKLLRVSIADMVGNSKFDPSQFSERIGLAKQYSDRGLSDQGALRLGKTIQDMMSLRLDVDMSGGRSAIRIDDRSPVFYKASDVLLKSNGIEGASAESYKGALSRITRATYSQKRAEQDVSHLPEEFASGQLEGNVFLQELSPELASKDPFYLAKVFAGVSDWYSQRNAPFMDSKGSSGGKAIVFSALTKSDVIAEQGFRLGLSVKKVTLNELSVLSHDGKMGQAYPSSEVYSISAPLAYINGPLAPLAKQVKVQQGTAALRQGLGAPLSD